MIFRCHTRRVRRRGHILTALLIVRPALWLVAHARASIVISVGCLCPSASSVVDLEVVSSAAGHAEYAVCLSVSRPRSAGLSCRMAVWTWWIILSVGSFVLLGRRRRRGR